MGLDYGTRNLKCPCNDFNFNKEFQTIATLNNVGLKIYRHKGKTNAHETTLVMEITADENFVLENSSNLDILAEDFIPAFEQNKISCQHCKKVVEHIESLLKSIQVIKNNDIRGICDHCRSRPETQTCRRCQEILRRFKVAKTKESGKIKKRVVICLEKVPPNSRKSSTGGDRSPPPIHFVEMQQMYYPECLQRRYRHSYADNLSARTAPPYYRPPKLESKLFKSSSHGDLVSDFGEEIKKYQPDDWSDDSFINLSALRERKRKFQFVFPKSHKELEVVSELKYISSSSLIKDILDKSRKDGERKEKTDMIRKTDLKQEKDRDLKLKANIPEGGESFQYTSLLTAGKKISQKILADNLHEMKNKYFKGEIERKKKYLQESKENHMSKILSNAKLRSSGEHEHISKGKKDKLTRHKSDSQISIKRKDKSEKRKANIHDDKVVIKRHSEINLDKLKYPLNVLQKGKTYSEEHYGKHIPRKEKTKLKSKTQEMFSKENMQEQDLEKEQRNIATERKGQNGNSNDLGHRLSKVEKERVFKEGQHTFSEKDKINLKTGDKFRLQKVDEELGKSGIKTDDGLNGLSKKDGNVSESDAKNKRGKYDDKLDKSIKRDKDLPKKEADKGLKSSTAKTGQQVMDNNLSKGSTKRDENSQELSGRNLKSEKYENERKKYEDKLDKSTKRGKELPKEEADKVLKSSTVKSGQQDIDNNLGKGSTKRYENSQELPGKKLKSEKYENERKQLSIELSGNKGDKVKNLKFGEESGHKTSGQDIVKKHTTSAKQNNNAHAKKEDENKDENLKVPFLNFKKNKNQAYDLPFITEKAGEAKIFQQTTKPNKQNLSNEIETVDEQENGLDKEKKLKENKFKFAEVLQFEILKDALSQDVKQRKPILEKTSLDPKDKEMASKILAGIISHLPIVSKHRVHRCIASDCIICDESDVDLDLDSWRKGRNNKADKDKYVKCLKVQHTKNLVPLQQTDEDDDPIIELQSMDDIEKKLQAKSKATLESHIVGSGILRYALSDRTFIENGCTVLPVEKVIRRMNVYRMRPVNPEFDWFEHNKSKRFMHYDTGEKLAEIDEDGHGRWYYRNGRLALDFYGAKELNAEQRFVIYSSGEKDQRGRSYPITVLATFDYLGNGIVFDHSGKIRLKYNQTEGIVLDRGIGPVSHWKWHSLNDPPILQQVMMDTHLFPKDPNICKLADLDEKKEKPVQDQMLEVELHNFVKDKDMQSSTQFQPYQIKMKALKINDQFSLRILDQKTIYLIFRDGSTHLKLNLGMVLDQDEILDTVKTEIGEANDCANLHPPQTDSLAEIQRKLAIARRFDRVRKEREHRLCKQLPVAASADRLLAAVSHPRGLPPLQVLSTESGTKECYRYRKPPLNVYYDTRLI